MTDVTKILIVVAPAVLFMFCLMVHSAMAAYRSRDYGWAGFFAALAWAMGALAAVLALE